MENATKALIIAGEILIGILILALLVFIAIRLSEPADIYHREVSRVEVDKFNSYFTKFGVRQDITPQEVVSAINYAREYNRR